MSQVARAPGITLGACYVIYTVPGGYEFMIDPEVKRVATEHQLATIRAHAIEAAGRMIDEDRAKR